MRKKGSSSLFAVGTGGGVEEVWEPCAYLPAVEVFAHKTPTANRASCLTADAMQSQIFLVLSVIISIVIVFADAEIPGINIGTEKAILGTMLAIYAVLSLLYMILAVAGKRAHILLIGGLADKYANRQPKGAKKIN